jgi:hypothetical protein
MSVMASPQRKHGGFFFATMLFYPQLLAGHSCYAADVPACLPSGGWGNAFRRELSLALLLGSRAELLRLRAALDLPPARPLFV